MDIAKTDIAKMDIVKTDIAKMDIVKTDIAKMGLAKMDIAKIADGNTIYVYDATQFDVDAIMHSGQVFRYFYNNGKYLVVSGSNYALIDAPNQGENGNGSYNVSDNGGTSNACVRDNGHAGDKAYAGDSGGKIVIRCSNSHYFYNYFDLNTNYNNIKRDLYKFTSIAPSIKAGGGIRILKADFAETVISFIISANNNIKRFTKTLNLLCQGFGTKLTSNHLNLDFCKDIYAFPTISQLEKATEEDFKSIGCGYRSGYLVEAVRGLKNIDYNQLLKLNDKCLRQELLKIKGVGPKVCACIMLFCFNRLNIAPVDTWIKKALEQLPYGQQEGIFGHKYAGVAQQYIFYYLQYLRKSL